jgi:MFS family permease
MDSQIPLGKGRNFALFFCVTTLSNIGGWMQRVVLGMLVWKITGSAFWLGVFVAVEVVTVILVGPLGGVWTDRQNARKLIAWCCFFSALASFALALLTALDRVNIPVLLLLAMVSGLVQAVAGPATQSLIASLFKQDNVPSVVAINSVTFNIARFIGPVLALLAIHDGSYALVFLLNGLSFVPQILALRFYDVEKAHVQRSANGRTVAADLKEGFSYVLGVPAIASLLTAMAATSLIARPFMDLIPSIADRQFSRMEDGTALLTSACGIGALLGGLALTALGKRPQLRNVPLFTVFLLGLSLMLLSQTENFHIALAMALVFGLAAVTNAVSTISLLQLNASPEHRGRVMSYYFMVFRGCMSLGALLQGVLQDTIGTRTTLLLAGGTTVLIGIVICRKWRSRITVPISAQAQS